MSRMEVLVPLLLWAACACLTSARDSLSSSGGIGTMDLRDRRVDVPRECDVGNHTSSSGMNGTCEHLEPSSGLTELTVRTFAETVGVPGRLSLVALYCGTREAEEDEEEPHLWKWTLMADVNTELHLPDGHDFLAAGVDVCREKMMDLLIPLWQRDVVKSASIPTLHVLLLEGQAQDDQQVQVAGVDQVPSVVLSRHTGTWEEIKTRLVHRIQHAAARNGSLVADIHTQGDLMGLHVPTGQPIVLLTCGKEVERSVVHAQLKPVICQWAERGLVRDQTDGNGDGSLPAFVVMQEDPAWATEASQGRVRVQVVYSAVTPLSPAVTWELTPDELPTKLPSLLREWDMTPLVDSSLGYLFLARIMARLPSGLLPGKARYAMVLPCTSSDLLPSNVTNPSLMAKGALSPLVPSLLASRQSVHTFCAPLSLLQNPVLTKAISSKGTDHDDKEKDHAVAAVMFDSEANFYTGQEHMLIKVADVKGPDWSKARHLTLFENGKAHMLENNRLENQWYRNVALEKLDKSPDAFVHWFEQSIKKQDGILTSKALMAENGTRTYSSKFVTTMYNFMENIGLDMDERGRVAEFFEQQSQHELSESKVPERSEEDLTSFWPRHMLDSDSPEDHTDTKAKGVKDVIRRLAEAIGRRDKYVLKEKDIKEADALCSAVRRAEVALHKMVSQLKNSSELQFKDYAPLVAVLDKPTRCKTTSGFFDEDQILEAMRKSGPQVIGEIAKAFRRSIEDIVSEGSDVALHEGDEDEDEYYGISLIKAYDTHLRQGRKLSNRLSKLRSIANEVARTHNKMRFKTLQFGVDDPWPVAEHIKPLPRYDVSSLTLQEFGRLATEGQPLILMGFNMTKDQLWTPEVLKEKCGALKFEVGEVVKRHKRSRRWGGIVPGSLTSLTLADYIDSHLDKLKQGHAQDTSNDSSPTYMLDVSLQQRCGSIFGNPPFDHFQFPPHLATNYYEHSKDSHDFASHWPSAFCGPKGTGTGMHEDNSLTEFFMLLTSGQKHWRMFRPAHRFLVYHDFEYNTFAADAFNPDLDNFPLLAYADVFEGKQSPGEVLFIPSGVIHAIHNTGDFSCGVTANYLDRWGMHHSLYYHLVDSGEQAIKHHLRHVLSATAPEPLDLRPSALAGKGPLITDMLEAWLDWGISGRETNVTGPVGFGVYRSGGM